VVGRGRTGTLVRVRTRSDSYGNSLWNLKHRIEHTAGRLWRHTQLLPRGRFPLPTTCLAILSGLFCLRPVYSLVREGHRNLVVTLRKQNAFLQLLPGGCGRLSTLRAPLAHATINACGLRSSVHEPAHAYVHHNPQGQEHEQY